MVQTLNRNGIDVTVNFPEQSNWTGVISEMELVPGNHPRHRLVRYTPPLSHTHSQTTLSLSLSLNLSLSLPLSCHECKINPIEGPRYHCQVCGDFDFCQKCFDQGQAHNHAFERFDDQGQPAVYVGSPRSRRKRLKR